MKIPKYVLFLAACICAMGTALAFQPNNNESSSPVMRYEIINTPCFEPSDIVERQCTNKQTTQLCAIITGDLRSYPSCNAPQEFEYIFRP